MFKNFRKSTIFAPRKYIKMKKSEIISQIRKAYVEAIAFKNAVQKLHLGFDVEKETVQQSHTDSAFGKWLYQDGQYLSQLKSFQDLEEKHEKTHRIFQAIYKLNIEVFEKDGVQMLISNTNKLKNDKRRLVDAYCKDFLKANTKLTTAIRKLYNDVAVLPKSCFKDNQLLTTV